MTLRSHEEEDAVVTATSAANTLAKAKGVHVI